MVKAIEKVTESKSWFFEEMSIFDKPLDQSFSTLAKLKFWAGQFFVVVRGSPT